MPQQVWSLPDQPRPEQQERPIHPANLTVGPERSPGPAGIGSQTLSFALAETAFIELGTLETSAVPTRPKRTNYDSRPKTGRAQLRAQAADRLDPAILAIITALARADARRDHGLAARDAADGEKADCLLSRRDDRQ